MLLVRPGRVAVVALGVCLAAAMGVTPTGAQDIPESLAPWVDGNVDGAHALLERVVNINSGTSNHEGVRQVGAIFRSRLDAIGFETEWLDVPRAMDRAGHLRAVRRGDGEGRSVFLIGHLDTVFEPGDAFDRYTRNGSRATGPGVVDDKGGAVVMLYALEALAAVAALDGSTITVLLTGDEESVGRPLDEARQAMVDDARASDVVLSFERGFVLDGEPYATVARRSSSRWTLTVEAKQAHSGRIFSEADGVGAVNEIARILGRFYTQLAGEEFLTFNTGVLLGGTDIEYDAAARTGSSFGRTNVIPKAAFAQGDLRTISQEQSADVRRRMTDIVAESLPHTSATITFRDGYPAMSPREANYALLREYSRASEAMGLGPILALDPGLRGAGDIAFASDHVAAALDGLGPQGGDTHGPGEWVDLDSFAPQIKRAAALIYRLTRSAGS